MFKIFVLLFSIFIFNNAAYCDSINPYVYKTMTTQSYRNNYRQNYKPMQYWQAQSNYKTRNQMNSTYSNYLNTKSGYQNHYYRSR